MSSSPPSEPSPPSFEPPIPTLTHISPAIFVPITQDLLAPHPPPPNRLARLRAILAALDAHAAAVRANLIALFDRERLRILQAAARDSAAAAAAGQAAPAIPRGPSRDAAADLIACVEAPAPRADPAWTASLGDVPLPAFDSAAARNPREWAALELMQLAAGVMDQVKGYEAHVAKTRLFYEQALARELESEAA